MNLNQLVGSTIEIKGAKSDRHSKSKIQGEIKQDRTAIQEYSPGNKTRAFLFVEIVCKYKNIGAYSYARPELESLIQVNETDIVNELLELQKKSPIKYAEQLNGHFFALSKKEKIGMTMAISLFLFRLPQFDYVFKKGMTNEEFQKVQP